MVESGAKEIGGDIYIAFSVKLVKKLFQDLHKKLIWITFVEVIVN